MGILRFVFSRTFVKHLISIALLILLLVAGVYFYLQFYTSHSTSFDVPDLKGMSIDEVEQALLDTQLKFEVIDSVYNEGAFGTVLDQIPEPGSKVKSERVIFLTVNAKTHPMKTMNVKIGETLRIAATKLDILGLEYETIYKPDFCNNCVLEILYKGKAISAGDKVRRGDKVVLVLGEKGNEFVSVPSLFGMPLDSAKQVLTRASLTIGYPFYDSDISNKEDSLNARVYKQSPSSANAELRVGSPVDVWLTTKNVALDDNSDPEK